MKEKKWTYAPGEATEHTSILRNEQMKTRAYHQLVKGYAKENKEHSYTIMHDNMNLVLFLECEPTKAEDKSRKDVFLWDYEGGFKKLQRPLSNKVSKAYVAYVDAMVEAVDSMEAETNQ